VICTIKALQQVEVQEVSVMVEGLAKGDGYFEKIDPTTTKKIHLRTSIVRNSKNILKIYCK
jgi:hypothetical protein